MRRALGLLIGGNVGEVGLQVGAGLLGMVPPLSTTQVLAVNLITDVLPAVAIALQKPESRDLSTLAREGTQAMDAPLRRDILRRGSAVALPSLLAYIAGSRLMGPLQGRSIAFIGVVVTQMAQTLAAGRTEGGLTRPVAGAVAASLSLLGLALTVPSLRTVFNLAVPSPLGWGLIALEVIGALLISRAPTTLPGSLAVPRPRIRALPAPARVTTLVPVGA